MPVLTRGHPVRNTGKEWKQPTAQTVPSVSKRCKEVYVVFPDCQRQDYEIVTTEKQFTVLQTSMGKGSIRNLTQLTERIVLKVQETP